MTLYKIDNIIKLYFREKVSLLIDKFKDIKVKIKAAKSRKELEQKQRIQRLKEIETQKDSGFRKVLHPIKNRKLKKEEQQLQAEINAYGSIKIMIVVCIVVVCLIIFAIIMSSREDNSNDSIVSPTESDYVYSEIEAESETVEYEIESSMETESITVAETTETPTTVIVTDAISTTEKVTECTHYYYDGVCTLCGAEDPSFEKGQTVWVSTKGGTKYHNYPSCSNMTDAIEISIEKAKSQGYEACKRCH